MLAMPAPEFGLLLAQAAGNSAEKPGAAVFVALLVFIAASVWLGTLAQAAMDKRKYMEGFFLGNRGLGAWALALTATVQSGGTFMGFPSLVYSHGWVVALWIGSYMVVPLTGFTILGKRLAQLSRRTNAITVPDLLRTRFDDPRVGVAASLLIMLFMGFMMVAQFKAGAIVMKLSAGDLMAFSEEADVQIDVQYYVGLAVFSLTVIGYTLIGGFLASVWTDLFQSVMMFFGVMALLVLALLAVDGGMEQATRNAVANTSMAFASGPGYAPNSAHEFLPIGLAMSMFFVWIWGGFSSPASMVRVMAAQNTEVMRKSIFLLSCYNCCIYIPLIIICVCGRTIFPNLEQTDEIIPRLAIHLTKEIPGGSMITALILAAPFGAIMATVSCYLLVISAGLVQDVYLRFVNPQATGKELRMMTNISMIGVGVAAIVAVINPPTYLQAVVVMSTSVGASALAIPMLMACYWRRATATGTLTAMLAGAGTVLVLFGLGQVHAALTAETSTSWVASLLGTDGMARMKEWLGPAQTIGMAKGFKPYFVLGLEPVVWGLLASAVCGVGVSLATRPPSEEHLQKFFDTPAMNAKY
jgi:SSS family solute:Na+ symporter/sodium/pantothenate symporter